MSTAAYANFDLLVDRGSPPADYRARVIQSPAGEAVTDFTRPFSSSELADFLQGIDHAEPRPFTASAEASPTLDPCTFGTRLYDAVFAGSVGLCLRRSLDEAERRGVGLRLRLRLAAGALDLAELPWELLFAPDLSRFLALSDLTPIVRYIELDRPVQPLRARLPLTVLAIVASPSDAAPLAVEREWQNLQAALDPLIQCGALVLERLASATLPALQERLRRGPVDLLHFVGHGFFDRQSDTGGLVFENARGRTAVVTAETLGLLLHDHEALRLIFLNACQAAQGGRSDPFAGVAQRLVQQGAPAVLAMQFPVSDDAGAALAQVFYQALADGLPADAALSQARKALAARGNAQEWATPVLFSRSDDNHLFDLLDVLPAPACPYPGMVPFRAEDARFFCGREAEIEHVLQHLRHQRLLFVIGPSGSGKSSLLAAGVLPKLARSAHFPPAYWLVRTLRPGSRPREALGAALAGDVSQPAEAIAQLLAANALAQRVLLVIDQFEELFSLADADQRQEFMACFQALRGVEQCALVAAMRADFYPDLMNSDLWPVDASQRLEVAALRGDALRRAIRQPADQVEVEVADALVERLLADAAGEPGALPMLQETLQLLWARMRRRRLTPEDYDQLGDGSRSGLAVAIATKADATLAELAPAEQGVARRIFLRLIQFGQGRLDTRRQLPEAELRSAGRDPALFARVLKQLAGNRLLTLSGGESGAERLVDIAHERLITEWPRLNEWVKQHKAAELMRRRLEDKAQEWVRLGRGAGGLLDKAELAEAGAWLEGAGAAELGASADLLALAELSRNTISPGWHGVGAALLAAGGIATAALAALLPIVTVGMAWPLRSALFLAAALLLILLSWSSGLLRQNDPYRLQRLSQAVATRKWLQGFLLLLGAGSVTAWAAFGISAARTTAYCASQGYTDSPGQSVRVALSATALDPYYLKLVRDELGKHPNVHVWIVPAGDVERCSAFFSHFVQVQPDSPPGGSEVGYAADIREGRKGSPNHELAIRPQEQCDMFAEIGQKIISRLPVAPLQVLSQQEARPQLASCQAFMRNQEGDVAAEQGDYGKAEALFKEAVALEPNFAVAHNNLGLLYLAANDYDQARAEFVQATSLRPTNGLFQLNLGIACYQLDDYSCGETSYQRSIQHELDDPTAPHVIVEAYNNLSVLYREWGKFAEADQALTQAALHLADLPPSEELYQLVLLKNRGILRFREGRLEEAIGLLLEATASDSQQWWTEEITYYLALAYEGVGDLSQACASWLLYDVTPSGGLFKEDERRTAAAIHAAALGCKTR